ncbi:MAG: xylulose kinase, partial [Deltaproteobacteria bacterium]|nr:xylulose kinase [Deltaproteobacteria bacterium]
MTLGGNVSLVLGVDCSTTGCKAIVFDGAGQSVAEGRAPIELRNPEPDGWEQDANDWWRAFGAACRAAMAQVDDPARLRALCVAHQRETVVLTDEGGKPIHPALVWMDKRGSAQVERARARFGDKRLRELSGKPPCITPSLYKLMALFDRLPALRRYAPRVLDVHAFLALRLTGRWVTSLASADPTGMVDMAHRRWAPELCELAGLDPAWLPELVEPGAVMGVVNEAASKECGLRVGLPVVAGAGDGQAAGLGAGIVAPGSAYLNLGTAVVSGVLTRSYQCENAFRTLYGAIAGSYFLETDLQGGTFTITWLIERFLGAMEGGSARSFDQVLAELEGRAADLPPGADGLLLVPYWNGVMNPLWDDRASGVVVGWRGSHEPAHLYRAVLEGIAYEQRWHTAGVEQAVGEIPEYVVMGGGSRSDLWCQILADVTQKPVVRAGTTEASALGAAILAAVSSGLHPTEVAASEAMTRRGRQFVPGEA